RRIKQRLSGDGFTIHPGIGGTAAAAHLDWIQLVCAKPERTQQARREHFAFDLAVHLAVEQIHQIAISDGYVELTRSAQLFLDYRRRCLRGRQGFQAHRSGESRCAYRRSENARKYLSHVSLVSKPPASKISWAGLYSAADDHQPDRVDVFGFSRSDDANSAS